MAIRAHTTVFQVNRDDDKGRPVKTAHTYSFASVAQNAFTYPISLAGAKSVWVQNTTALEAAEYWIPSYSSGAINVSGDPVGKMRASEAATGIGVGMDIVLPSTAGAGFIGGNCVPPALSVKHTGTTESVIVIHITY